MTETYKPKRPTGRPRGLGKVPGSGRQRGTPNRDRAATIEKIMREADPLLFLCKVARGDRMEAGSEPGASKKSWWAPTGDQRISAAQTLARKVLPDMKAVELTGEPPVITSIKRTIVDPVSKPAETPAAGNGAANGLDQDPPDPAPRTSVDVLTQQRKIP